MTVYLVQSEVLDFRTQNGIMVWDSTLTRFREDAYGRGAMHVQEFSSIRQNLDSTTPILDLWVHFNLGQDILDSNQDARYFRLYDNTTDTIVLELNSANGVPQIFSRQNNVLIQIGGFNMTLDVPMPMDFHIVLSTTVPLVEWYVNGSLIQLSTVEVFDNINVTTVNQLYFQSPRGGLESGRHGYYSEIICASLPTIGWRVNTLAPNSAGSTAEWSGLSTAYRGVNELPVSLDDTRTANLQFINTDSTNKIHMFGVDSPSTVITALEIKAVAVTSRVKIGSSGPQNVQLGVRTGSSNNFSTNMDLIGNSLTGVFKVFQDNPNTSTTWQFSELETLEIGVRSVT